MKKPTRSVFILAAALLASAVAAIWLGHPNGRASHHPILPFVTVRPVLERFGPDLPPELREPNESKWKAWAEREDDTIRARLEEGARDSMINMLLFGTSFTDQPRARGLLPPEDPVLQSRLNDFLTGVRDPRGNERLALVQNLLKSRNLKIDSPGGYEQAKAFVVENLMRVKQQQSAFRQRLENPASESGQKIHEGVFHDRGIALDTKILSSFGMSAALRDMKNRGAISEGNRVAVIGPGLDFTDKGFGYDFYPLQTLQPFAIYDSLVQLGLAKAGKIDIVAFDISSEVLDHLRGARERARRDEGYVVQLPRESRPWVSDAIEYWRSFGSVIGEPVTAIQPPPALKDLETRAVRIRPDVVLSCKPVDLNFVLEQPGSVSGEQFDLVIATNVFVYYDALEQALALQNISALLKPGGFLLTNEPLQVLSEIPMKAVEYTSVQYGQGEFERDKIFWWQRQ